MERKLSELYQIVLDYMRKHKSQIDPPSVATYLCKTNVITTREHIMINSDFRLNKPSATKWKHFFNNKNYTVIRSNNKSYNHWWLFMHTPETQLQMRRYVATLKFQALKNKN